MSPSTKTVTRSDEELMDLVQGSDDRDAFACLYDRYSRQAFLVARSVCVSSARAEEAVQEGFLSIWKGRAKFDSGPPRGSFGAWAMTIVRCAAVDSLRYDSADKRPKLSGEQVQPVDPRTPSPEDQAIVRHDSNALRATLAELPDAQAEVIELAFFGELSHAEIAQQLGLPPGTVKGRMRLGLEKLRTSVDRVS